MALNKFKSFVNYIKPKKVSPSGLYIYFGQRGTGKTTLIAKEYWKQWKRYKKGKCSYKHFYTNVKIYNEDDHDFYRYIDLYNYKLTDYIDPKICECKISTYSIEKNIPYFIDRNNIIYIDEMGTIAHARNYKNFPTEIINLVKYLRHLSILMICNSQSYDIDKTLRTGANELRLLKKILFWNVSRRIKKEIKVSNDKENADEQISDHIELAKFYMPNAINITFIPFYTDLFNSYE